MKRKMKRRLCSLLLAFALLPAAAPAEVVGRDGICLLYTSPSPRDRQKSRMPSSA